MLTFAATAARIARSPEWKYVPSPRFAKMCFSSVNGACPIQAFRYGKHAYGMQFHVEVTEETVPLVEGVRATTPDTDALRALRSELIDTKGRAPVQQ